ncbi:type I-MYXAN CRISPR-associated protein Cas6/Cmx6 [Geotalea uraniireducens]|uniref:type I-MYXAN CRISPR-associated protein Cas6/Cmx6 n=1 Tax=Geotalea uraniireducens TaxID=351604 RepID=UPI000A030C5C
MDTQVIDLAFPVQGKTVPVDHGYALYGALSRICPHLPLHYPTHNGSFTISDAGRR